MNFFKKKKKIYISLDESDLKNTSEGLMLLFLELNQEISTEEILIIKFAELQELNFSILSIVISFIVHLENTRQITISIQAEPELFKKLKEANFAPIVSKLIPT